MCMHEYDESYSIALYSTSLSTSRRHTWPSSTVIFTSHLSKRRKLLPFTVQICFSSSDWKSTEASASVFVVVGVDDEEDAEPAAKAQGPA